MDVKRWFKEDKGGFGAFLFLVIMGLVFYVLQRKDPGGYEPGQIKELKATEMVVAREPKITLPPDAGLAATAKPAIADRTLPAPDSVTDPVNSQVKTTGAKSKPKPKYTRKKLSREDIVRRKLRAG